jgi:enoyl-CoA hydratase/carnithine racemase
MRADRGFFCLPEVDINLPFAPGMRALIQAKLDPSVSHDLMLTGRRLGGTEAAALRVVDETADADQVLARAIARAESLAGKERTTYAAIRCAMYEPVIRLLTDGQ